MARPHASRHRRRRLCRRTCQRWYIRCRRRSACPQRPAHHPNTCPWRRTCRALRRSLCSCRNHHRRCRLARARRGRGRPDRPYNDRSWCSRPSRCKVGSCWSGRTCSHRSRDRTCPDCSRRRARSSRALRPRICRLCSCQQRCRDSRRSSLSRFWPHVLRTCRSTDCTCPSCTRRRGRSSRRPCSAPRSTNPQLHPSHLPEHPGDLAGLRRRF